MMDRRLFARLLDERKDAVYGYALYMLSSVDEAEDVTQDVFLKLFRQGGEVEEAALSAWLMRVCRNACLDRLRRIKVRRSHRADPSQTVSGAGVLEEGSEASGREASFDLSDEGAGAEGIEQRVEIDRLVEAMQELPEPQRSVILLRESRDMAYQDIAELLGISLSSVKVSLHRARRKVREMFTEERGAEL